MATATSAIVNADNKKRHPLCSRHLREALAQCPLEPQEKIRNARRGEECEECPVDPPKTEAAP